LKLKVLEFFSQILSRGVLEVVEKYRGEGAVLLHSYDQVKKQLRGYIKCPPPGVHY
jgi:hypothetical protein